MLFEDQYDNIGANLFTTPSPPKPPKKYNVQIYPLYHYYQTSIETAYHVVKQNIGQVIVCLRKIYLLHTQDVLQ
jgi:hypothetical protein